MPSKFPGPFINDTKVDTSVMHYICGGDFSQTEIGARTSGLPKDVKNDMNISHVGDATPGAAKTKFP